jgi:hypothetical protein
VFLSSSDLTIDTSGTETRSPDKPTNLDIPSINIRAHGPVTRDACRESSKLDVRDFDCGSADATSPATAYGKLMELDFTNFDPRLSTTTEQPTVNVQSTELHITEFGSRSAAAANSFRANPTAPGI